MKELIALVDGVDVGDARAAFYYLSRYLKQAEYYDRYEKDFFEDDFQSEPSEFGKELTFKLISFIEGAQKKKASEFTDDEYIFWADKINEIESNLDPELTSEQVESARVIIEEIYPPILGRKD